MSNLIFKEYGPPPGMESLDERRKREIREKEERERKMKEIEEKRKRKVRIAFWNNKLIYLLKLIIFQDNFNEYPHINCIKIAETCEIASKEVYCL